MPVWANFYGLTDMSHTSTTTTLDKPAKFNFSLSSYMKANLVDLSDLVYVHLIFWDPIFLKILKKLEANLPFTYISFLILFLLKPFLRQ